MRVHSVERHRIWFVRMAELVQMLLPRSARVDITQRNSGSDNMDSPRQLVKRALRLTFYPHVQAVVSVWNTLDMKRTRGSAVP